MVVFSWAFFMFFVCSNISEAYNILVVFPFPARSHDNLGKGIVRHLLKAGHEVTHITPYPIDKPASNLRQIDVSSNKDEFPEDSINIHTLMLEEVALNNEQFRNFAILKITNATFYNENVTKLLNDPKQHFDIVIAEWMFNEVYAGLAAVFNCSYIWTYPYEPNGLILSLIDETTNPAYVPQLISDYVAPLTFLQRVQELFNQIFIMTLKHYYFSRYERNVYETIFTPILEKRNKKLPPYDVMRYNASLMFGCSHVTLGQAIRLPQNYKDIGGFYIDDQVKPLPKDLQKIMDAAENGVIYFSMGSNLKSKHLDPIIKKRLLKVFAELKQTVLWKFEEKFQELPKNVHVVEWAPQQSILAHKNCILFITHGGLLSSTEAVHFGVPIVGIPVFMDQFSNVNRAVKKGYAKRVDLTYNLAEDLKQAIDDMLSDPRYMAKTKQLSSTYHDRLVGPGPEMVHWVEHVVRTRGAPHLSSPALHVPLYQKLYLDLAVTLLLILLLLRAVLSNGNISKIISNKASKVLLKDSKKIN